MVRWWVRLMLRRFGLRLSADPEFGA